MASVPRYKGGGIQPVAAGTTSARAKSQMLGTLADRIQSFQGGVVKQQAAAAGAEATAEAEKAFSEQGLNAQINTEATIYGQTYTETLSNLHKKQVSIDTSKQMSDLAVEYESDPMGFKTVTDAYRKSTVGKLPPHLQADFAIDFEASKARYEGKIKQNYLTLKKNEDIAASNELFTVSNNNATLAARDGNPNLAMYEMDKALKIIDDDEAKGYTTPQEASKRRSKVKMDVSSANFRGALDTYLDANDVQGAQDYVNGFRDTTPEGFDEQSRDKLGDEMQKDINTKIKQNNAVLATTKNDATIAVKDGIKILKSGKYPSDLDSLIESLPMVSLENQHEFQVQLAAHKVTQQYGDLSLPEQQAAVNILESKPEATRVGAEVLATIKSNLRERATKAKNDPISLGAQEGLYKQTAPLSPLGGITPLLGILPERVQQQTANRLEYGEGANQLLTAPEAAEYAAWFNAPTTSEVDKLEMIKAVEAGAQGQSGAFYNQILKKGAGTVAFAGGLVRDGKEATARKVLHGQMVLKALDNPEEAGEMRIKLLKNLGNATRRMGEGSLNAILDSGVALYAYTLEDQGIFDKGASSSDMNKIIKELTNGTHDRNGQSFFLPNGVDDDDFDDWIDELKPEDIGPVAGIAPEQVVTLIQRGGLNSIGNGKYAVFYQGRALKNPDGTTYKLEYIK